MKIFGIVSILVCTICVISVNGDTKKHKKEHGLAYADEVPRDSNLWRLAEFIRSQARFPIRSFSTEDYSDDEEDSQPAASKPVARKPATSKKPSSKQSSSKTVASRPVTQNMFDAELRPAQPKLLKPNKSKKYSEKNRW